MEAEQNPNQETCMELSSDVPITGQTAELSPAQDSLDTHDTPSDQTTSATCCGQLSCRTIMLERVAKSDGHFKHQQRGDPDLTHAEKLQIATDLLDNKPGSFLTRFSKFLEAEDLINFHSLSDDYIIGFQLKEIRTRLNVSANQTIVKNRRYEAMMRLVDQGEYFEDELLKQRDPLLYEQMVGQHLDGDEINAQVNKSDLRFSTILLSHLDIIRNNELYQKQKETEAARPMDESDSDNDSDEKSEEESELESEDEDGNPKSGISAEEKKMLREEFVTTMKHRFLNGEDVDFDYTEVDTNEEYDSLDIREHDEQERYFDNEEPETVEMEPDLQEGAAGFPGASQAGTSEGTRSTEHSDPASICLSSVPKVSNERT